MIRSALSSFSILALLTGCPVGTEEGDDDTAPLCDGDEDGEDSPDCEGEDCDDTDPDIHPGTPEVCDGVDTDCDPLTDEEVDGDLDTYTACEGDCNDGQQAQVPSWVGWADDPMDDLDNDCDGTLNEGSDGDDIDGDGYSESQGDCNDSPVDGATSYPGHLEIQGDGLDNDCDEVID